MRILLVDDHDLFREGLKYLLPALDKSVQFVEANSLEIALSHAKDKAIDLILLDYHMPGVVGLGALQSLREKFESARIVLVSGEEDSKIIRAAIELGAAGFIPKASSREVLVSALKQVLGGGTYLPPSTFTTARSEKHDNAPESANLSEQLTTLLTRRQFEVLMNAVQGKSNKIIAKEMGISDHTVKAHLSVAYRMLNVQNRTEAVYAAAKLGIHLNELS